MKVNNKEKLNWTDWLNAYNNFDDKSHYNDLEILRKYKDSILEESRQKDIRIVELENEVADLKSDWNKLCDYLGNEIADQKDCENGCYIEFLKKVNEIRPYKADIKKE